MRTGTIANQAFSNEFRKKKKQITVHDTVGMN